MRPALLGRGSRSLVNLINVQSLMKRGQGNATLMFSCGVSTLGNEGGGEYYRGTPNSDMLGREVVERCDQAQSEPAVFHHNRVSTWISGTVTFIGKDGKPHLGVFLNQEEKNLFQGHDFIAPQFAFVPGNYKFRGINWPTNSPGHSGMAAVTLDVDTTGKVLSAKTSYEYPPGMGFGREVVGRIRDALFIPGYRDGKPVRCQFTWALMFNGPGRQMKTG